MERTTTQTRSGRIKSEATSSFAWERLNKLGAKLSKLWKTKKTTAQILREERR